MFSLIISIIAIALVIVLAGASLYYGGEAFNSGTAKGEAAKLLNEGQQIAGAYTMHKVDEKGAVPLTVTELNTDGYLAVDLTTWSIGLGDAAGSFNGLPVAIGAAASDDVCTAITDAANSQATCATNVVEYRL